MRTFAIGDIHGQAGKLRKLLSYLRDRAEPGDTLLFVGDYIDRGPDSRGVIELVMEQVVGGWNGPVVPLRGNHEALMLDQLGRNPTYELDLWMQNGGLQTLASYGDEALTRRWKQAIPRLHQDFLAKTRLWHEDEHGFYVHAGLLPEHHPSELDEEVLLWIREPFLEDPGPWDRVVVFGHTPQFEGEDDGEADLSAIRWRPLNNPEKIGIDTGAGYGGPLTSVMLPDREFVSVR